MTKTTGRVAAVTAPEGDARIRYLMEARIAYYAEHPDEIDTRLRELDAEWDIERSLQANAAALILGSTLLGLFGGARWRVLPLVVSGFLLQHALGGWCPPIPLFRRLGVRTPREIEWERNALKALRGDYVDVGHDGDGPDVAFRAARR